MLRDRNYCFTLPRLLPRLAPYLVPYPLPHYSFFPFNNLAYYYYSTYYYYSSYLSLINILLSVRQQAPHYLATAQILKGKRVTGLMLGIAVRNNAYR